MTVSYGGLTTTTSIRSFQQLCEEADPNWQIDKTSPWIYEFSSGRRFYQPVNPYNFNYVDEGTAQLDKFDLDFNQLA